MKYMNKNFAFNKEKITRDVDTDALVSKIMTVLRTGDSFTEDLLNERGDIIEVYLLIPNIFNERLSADTKYFLKFAFSLILGRVVIKRKGETFTFHGNPRTILKVIREYIGGSWEDNYNYMVIENLYFLYFDSGLVDFCRNHFGIQTKFDCKYCGFGLKYDSFTSIVECNPSADFFKMQDYIYCPLCGNPIILDNSCKEIILSYHIEYSFMHFFNIDIHDEIFKLKYFSCLNPKRSDSKNLKTGNYGLLNKQTYVFLFGVTRDQFGQVWNLFTRCIVSKMAIYQYFKTSITQYEDGSISLGSTNDEYEKEYDYLLKNADRLIRLRKLNKLITE
jgi:hypothetical protein